MTDICLAREITQLILYLMFMLIIYGLHLVEVRRND